MNKIIKEEKVKNKKAFLLKSLTKNGFEFIIRIYNEDKTFIDYDIGHNDLEILITDDFATLYEMDDGNNIIDYNREFLVK